MPNYRRLISYIYAYEGGVKGKNIGFAKIESRGVQCKITVNVKKVYVGNNDTGVYLLSGDQEIFLGNIFIRGGGGEFRTVVSVSDVEHSGISMEECFGLTVHDVENTWRSYTTIWEDAVAHAAEVELAETVSASNSGNDEENGVSMEKIRDAVREIAEEFPAEPLVKGRPAYIPAVEFSTELTPQWTAEQREVNLKTDLPDGGKRQGTDRAKPAQEDTAALAPLEEPDDKLSSVCENTPPIFEPEPDRREESLWGVTSEELCGSLAEWETICYRADSQSPDFLWKTENTERSWDASCIEPVYRTMAAETKESPLLKAEDDLIQGPAQVPERAFAEKSTEAIERHPVEEPGQSPQSPPMEEPAQAHEEEPGQTLEEETQEAPPLPGFASEPDLEAAPGSSYDIWESLRRKHTKITDFDYENGCEILTIKPQDIGLLPRENWTLGNNSFLLHGYYNYRYLIIARLNNPGGMPRFLLGVPGHYYDNERYMAAMFGFPNFVLSKDQPMQDGRFGYWYTDIKLETGEES